MQKVEIYYSNEGSGPAIFTTDLEHIIGSKIGVDFSVMLRREGLHKPEVIYHIVRKHSLMIYANLIE